MNLSLTDLAAGLSALLISLAATAATLALLTIGAAGAYTVAAGHTRVQNAQGRKFLAIAVLSAAITITLQINGLTLAPR